jgi:hypothetical protein
MNQRFLFEGKILGGNEEEARDDWEQKELEVVPACYSNPYIRQLSDSSINLGQSKEDIVQFNPTNPLISIIN